MTAYDLNDVPITATATISPQYLGAETFGPQLLTDTLITGLPAHTTNDPNAYMELDLGSMKDISKIVIENRRDCCTSRIIGTEIQIRNSDNAVVWSSEILTDRPRYAFDNQVAMIFQNKKYYLYGPWVKYNLEYIPVTKIDKVGNKTVYLSEDDGFTKMVNEDGQGKYYNGKIKDFDPTKWTTYNDAADNYKLRMCNSNCNSGCNSDGTTCNSLVA